MGTETRWCGGYDTPSQEDAGHPAPVADRFPAELHAMRHEVEARIDALLEGGDGDRLAMAMRTSALSAGKRMRPLLVMLVARDLGNASPAVIDVACAVEMVHAASLILDDMPCMDNATLRRGKPAIHVQFGEDVAILAAVALLSRAFGVLAAAPDVPPAIRARLVARLSDTVGLQGLVRGQYLDLHPDVHADRQRSVQDIATTNDLKTGVLLGVAVDMAAILADADDAVAASLRAFAFAAGQAFQIGDDFLDGAGNDSTVTGKDTGLDLGKATLMATLGADEARRRFTACLQDAERHLDAALGKRQRTRRFVRSLFARQNAAPTSSSMESVPGSHAYHDGASTAVHVN
jgi:geranylgeranyl diphosphate synthase type II